MEKNKETKTLSPKLDVVFQAFFGEIGNERITKGFLEINNKEEELAQDGTSSIKLVPIFLYHDTDKKLKVEFKIWNKQLTLSLIHI